jgi:hypothetical protein
MILFRFRIIAISLLVVMLSGCASSAKRGLLQEIKARHIPDIDVGPEVVLLEKVKIDHNAHIKSLISSDSRAHVFVIDRDKQLHHVEVRENELLGHEILGVLTNDATNQHLDAIEHPSGNLRVLAGERQFIRSPIDKKWQEIKGNLCSQFIRSRDELFCAFIAKGDELGAPMRRDWTVGWFILAPVAYWSDVIADKLVLAQETNNKWAIRAVFDPDTELSARSDFMIGKASDDSLHLLYRTSGDSKAFLVAFGPGGGGGWGGSSSRMEIRYAQLQLNQLLSAGENISDHGNEKGNNPNPFLSIQGLTLTPMPYFEKYEQPNSLYLLGSLNRHFAVNDISGDIFGLIWIYNLKLDDGIHKLGTADMPWINVKLTGGKWVPHFDILTASDLPETGWRWINDLGALIQNDSSGNSHVLLVKSRNGFWSSTHELCYFLNTGSDWSAPLILGVDLGIDSRRSLAVDETGKVFVAWENKSKIVVGRWILQVK